MLTSNHTIKEHSKCGATQLNIPAAPSKHRWWRQKKESALQRAVRPNPQMSNWSLSRKKNTFLIQTHLPIFKLYIQEVKVPENTELLLGGVVIHGVWIPGPLIRGHQAGLVFHEIQFPTAGEYNLNRQITELQRTGFFLRGSWNSLGF